MAHCYECPRHGIVPFSKARIVGRHYKCHLCDSALYFRATHRRPDPMECVEIGTAIHSAIEDAFSYGHGHLYTDDNGVRHVSHKETVPSYSFGARVTQGGRRAGKTAQLLKLHNETVAAVKRKVLLDAAEELRGMPCPGSRKWGEGYDAAISRLEKLAGQGDES